MIEGPMTTPICPLNNQPMVRDVREAPVTYKGHTIIVPLPGWYSTDPNGESIHSVEDMKVSDEALRILKDKLNNV